MDEVGLVEVGQPTEDPLTQVAFSEVTYFIKNKKIYIKLDIV